MMQRSLFALLLLTALAACENKTLTGPEAQRAYAKAAPVLRGMPDGVLILLNNARLASGQSLDGLDRASIQTVEIFKGSAARQQYGPGAEHGVILIRTTDSAFVARATVAR